MEIRQIGPGFAGEVIGLDLSKPQTSATLDAIHAGMDEHAVLVFRGQTLTPDQQLAFTKSLGPVEDAKGTALRADTGDRLPVWFADVSNLDENNKTLAQDDRRRLFALGNRLWHSDSSFKSTPAKYSLLYASSVVSRGGNTEFADMRHAWDTLDDETKARCKDLICEHSLIYSRGKLGFDDLSEEERERFRPVQQRLVRVHPVTGRKSLFLSSHIGTIVGWPTPEARAFILDLTEHASRPDTVYSHRWQVGDLVVWDNRQTMHRVREFPHDETRDMRRTTMAGDGPTVVTQQAAE